MNKELEITVKENGEEIFKHSDNSLFIVSSDRGLTCIHSTIRDMFEFCVKVQATFYNKLLSRLLEDCNPGVTKDELFNVITEIAKDKSGCTE